MSLGNGSWEVRFDQDLTFENPIVFKKREDYRGLSEPGMTWFLLAHGGRIKLRDTIKTQGIVTAAFIELARKDFVVLHNGPALEKHDEDSTSWVIDIELRKGIYFSVRTACEPPAKWPIAARPENIPLFVKAADVSQMGNLRFILKDFKTVQVWDEEKVVRILAGMDLQPVPDSLEASLQMSKAAIEARERVFALASSIQDHIDRVLRPVFWAALDGETGAMNGWMNLILSSELQNDQKKDIVAHLLAKYGEDKKRQAEEERRRIEEERQAMMDEYYC